jgi:hypothetical protein
MVSADYAKEYLDRILDPLFRLGLYETYEVIYKRVIQEAVRHDYEMRSGERMLKDVG